VATGVATCTRFVPWPPLALAMIASVSTLIGGASAYLGVSLCAAELRQVPVWIDACVLVAPLPLTPR
jgi:hypothetical protein